MSQEWKLKITMFWEMTIELKLLNQSQWSWYHSFQKTMFYLINQNMLFWNIKVTKMERSAILWGGGGAPGIVNATMLCKDERVGDNSLPRLTANILNDNNNISLNSSHWINIIPSVSNKSGNPLQPRSILLPKELGMFIRHDNFKVNLTTIPQIPSP